MNAQENWKQAYRKWKCAIRNFSDLREGSEAIKEMERYKRAAALERRLASAQRTIEAQAQRIAELERVEQQVYHAQLDEWHERM